MNLPNKLTIIRMFLTPVFLTIVLIQSIPYRFLIGLIVFVIASVTDALDGHLARKNNQITVFGKLTDPVADKMLTTAALLLFLKEGLCNIWIVMIILAREFVVTSVRLVASAQGVVIPANIWGKIKTNSQMISTVVILACMWINDIGYFPQAIKLSYLSNGLLWITAIFTVVSGVIYVLKSKKLIDFSK